MKKPEPRRKRITKKLSLVLFGLIVGVLISEAFLRIINYSYPTFYTTDPDVGFVLRPGFEGMFRNEGESYVRINSDGLRDREHSKAKPANTVRIAILGDSFIEAMHVPMEQTFSFILGPKLEECHAFGGKKIEVINFGVTGYSTAQELITLRKKVWDYSPDIVILAFTVLNDLYDNYRPLKLADEFPYFFYQDGKLTADLSFRDSRKYRWRSSKSYRLGRWFRDHLRIVQLIDYSFLIGKLRLAEWRWRARASRPEETSTGETAPVRQIDRDNMIYVEPRDDTWREAWHVTEGLIVQIRNEVEERGAKFLLLNIGSGIQCYPDPVVRQNFMRQIGINSLFYPNLRLKSLAQREHLDFLDLAPSMQSYAEQNKTFLYGFGQHLGDGHWNAAGHQVVADLLTQKICSDNALTR